MSATYKPAHYVAQAKENGKWCQITSLDVHAMSEDPESSPFDPETVTPVFSRIPPLMSLKVSAPEGLPKPSDPQPRPNSPSPSMVSSTSSFAWVPSPSPLNIPPFNPTIPHPSTISPGCFIPPNGFGEPLPLKPYRVPSPPSSPKPMYPEIVFPDTFPQDTLQILRRPYPRTAPMDPADCPLCSSSDEDSCSSQDEQELSLIEQEFPPLEEELGEKYLGPPEINPEFSPFVYFAAPFPPLTLANGDFPLLPFLAVNQPRTPTYEELDPLFNPFPFFSAPIEPLILDSSLISPDSLLPHHFPSCPFSQGQCCFLPIHLFFLPQPLTSAQCLDDSLDLSLSIEVIEDPGSDADYELLFGDGLSAMTL